MDTNLNVKPTCALGACGCIDVDVVAVLNAEVCGVIGRHVDVTVSDYTALAELNDTLRTDDGDGSRSLKLARLTNGRLYLENVGIGDRDLYLACATERTEHANALYRAHRGTDDGEGLLASVLPGLREVLEVSKGIALAEKHLKMLL